MKSGEVTILMLELFNTVLNLIIVLRLTCVLHWTTIKNHVLVRIEIIITCVYIYIVLQMVSYPNQLE